MHALFQLRQLFMRIREHFGIRLALDQRLALLDPAGEVFELAVLLDDGSDFAVGLGGLLVALRVGDDIRRRQSFVQFFVLQFDLF